MQRLLLVKRYKNTTLAPIRLIQFYPRVSKFMSNDSAKALMRSIIQRTATGPDLSKNITEAEACGGMQALLDQSVDPVQSAIFLISLRMKRETDAENKGILSAIQANLNRATAAVDEVLDIAEPYNGYNRTLPAGVFLPAVLAACGVPTITHGVETTSPKFGITHKQVLRAAGVHVERDPQAAAACLSGAAGWSYLDQSQFCPKLYALADLREKMIKRTVITTIETLVRPIRGQQKTHLLTGFVHKPYPRIYALLAEHAGFDSLLLVRGVEGGIIPSLRQAGKFMAYSDFSKTQEIDSDPQQLGIKQSLRALPFPDDLPAAATADAIGLDVDSLAAATAAAEHGIAALQGKHGLIYDGLVYTGAMTLAHLGKVADAQAGAKQIRQVLNNGSAWQHFQA